MLRFFAVGRDRSGIDRPKLHFFRQQRDQLRALFMDLADQDDGEFGFAFRHLGDRVVAVGGIHALGGDDVLDAKTVGDFHQMDDRCAADLRIGVDDRLCVDEDLLERRGGRDIRNRRTDAAAWHHLAGLLELGHQRRRGDDQIGGLPRCDGIAQQSGRTGGEVELMAVWRE